MMEDILFFIAKVMVYFIAVIIIIGIVLLVAACFLGGLGYLLTGDIVKSLVCWVTLILIGCIIAAVID